MVDRFLLGAVEAAILPAMLIFLLHWFSRAARGRANTFPILGNPITVMWLSAVSGFIIAATSWRWMFIVEGLPAIVWAFLFKALVADRPREATWLNDAEKDEIETRLAAEQKDLGPVKGGYLEAFRSRNVIVLSVQYLLWSIGVYGFVFWLPTVLKAAKNSGIGQIGLLSAVPYAFAAIAMLVASQSSDRTGNRREFVWTFLLLGTAAFVASIILGTGHYWVSYVLLIVVAIGIYAPYGPYFALIPEFLPQRVAGAAMALVNSAGALGGFVGAYVVGWLQGSFGNGAAFTFIAIPLGLSAVLMLGVNARGRAGVVTAATPAGEAPTPGRATPVDQQAHQSGVES